MKQTFNLILISLLVLVAGLATAQDLPDELTAASAALTQGRHAEALAVAQTYLRGNPRGRHVLAATLIAGRAELGLNRVDDALQRGQDVLIQADDDSPFLADAHLLLASVHQAEGDYDEAARELVRAFDSPTPSSAAQDEILTRLGRLMRGPAAYAANSIYRTARNEGTRRAIQRLLPTSASRPTVGLLLPDAESDWEHTESMRAGVDAALSLWRKDGGEAITLKEAILPDDPARAAAAARDLVRRDGCWAIIAAGPEEFAVPAVVEAQAAGVPVVLPGQGRPSFAGLGASVVLPTVNWREEGRLAAMYAADVLQLRTYGIVAPYTDQGRESVAGFLEMMEGREDVEILDQEWYRPEEGVSLSTQFRNLRTIGFQREFRDELIDRELLLQDSIWAVADSLGLVSQVGGQLIYPDSIDAHRLIWPLVRDSIAISDSVLQVEWRKHLLEVRQSMEFKTGNIDSNAISLRAYEALYLPIEPGTIPIFAPQFAFYSFDATRLGNSAWHDPDELLRHREYVEGLGITGHTWLKAINDPIMRLSSELGDSLNVSLDTWKVFGNDAVRLLLLGMTGSTLDQPGVRSAAITHRSPAAVGTALRDLRRASLASGRQTYAANAPQATGVWFLTVQNGDVVPLIQGVQTEATLRDAAYRMQMETGMPQPTQPQPTPVPTPQENR